MPRLRGDPWRAFTVERQAESLRPDDISLVRRYLAWRRTSVSAELVRREETWIVRWLVHLAGTGRTVADATEDDALSLAAQFDAWEWSASARQHFCAGLRSFYDFLARRKLAQGNPWQHVRAPRPHEYQPPVLSAEEVAALEDALTRPGWREVRDRALICVLTASACRLSEALGLDMDDLDLAHRRFLIRHGKGDKDRLALLGPKAVQALEMYLTVVRPLLRSAPGGPVFLGIHGKRLTSVVARDALNRACTRAGLPRHVWPHLLRHTTATHFLDGGAPLEQVQQLLGHRSMQTTLRYVRLSQAALRETYDRIFGGPRAAPGRFGS